MMTLPQGNCSPREPQCAPWTEESSASCGPVTACHTQCVHQGLDQTAVVSARQGPSCGCAVDATSTPARGTLPCACSLLSPATTARPPPQTASQPSLCGHPFLSGLLCSARRLFSNLHCMYEPAHAHARRAPAQLDPTLPRTQQSRRAGTCERSPFWCWGSRS